MYFLKNNLIFLEISVIIGLGGIVKIYFIFYYPEFGPFYQFAY